MNIELNGDMLPEQEDATLERRWSIFLGQQSEAWRVYTQLRELLADGVSVVDEQQLTSLLGVSKNRLYKTILPKLESFGLISHGPME